MDAGKTELQNQLGWLVKSVLDGGIPEIHVKRIVKWHQQEIAKARLNEMKSFRRTYKKKDGRANDLSKMTRAELDAKISELSQTLKEHKEK